MRLLKPLISSHADWFENVNIIYDAEALFTSRAFEQVEYSIEEEARFASMADLVIAVCDQEATNLQDLGVRNVAVLGHSLPAAATPKRFRDRKGFLFVGPIYNEKTPNGDSIVWFLTEILPRIRHALGAEASFTMAGQIESEAIRNLAAANSVQVLGYVPDLSECYDSSRVFVAPTRFGAGIPHKVHEAAARGVPVVATPLLAGQLGWRDGSTLAVGADGAEFAAKCVELYTNESLWTGIREAALNAIRSECSTEMFENRLTQILEGERTNAQHGIHRRTVHTVPTRAD
jgi:glycosyltransferase involved in cell wall biosynthesis